MGLRISHGAFNGPCRRFDRLRDAVCRAMGGSWPYEHGALWYWGDGFCPQTHPGLQEFLNHPDDEGFIQPHLAAALAIELGELMAKLETMLDYDGRPFSEMVKPLIAGCRLAAERNELLEFS